MNAETERPHVALVSSPGMGHLIPFLELASRLVSRHGFRQVTVFTSGASASHLIPPHNVHVVSLPETDMSALVGPTTSILVRCMIAVRLSLPAFRSAISSMKLRPAALIVDQFATEALAVATEFDMRKYVFFPCSAWFLALTLYVPNLDRGLEDRHVKDHEALSIPGCESVRFECTFEPILCRESDNERFSEYVRIGVETANSDGVLVNTWHDLEPKTLRALADYGLITKTPIFPIGPVVRPSEPGWTTRVREWLDMQPVESVIYVSFGSGGTMSAEQTVEIAWGLELSEQRFIWVVRAPVEGNAGASFFKKWDEDGSPDYLPDGFLTRTQELGVVVPKWAPQSEILGHASVGGFLSHCGWNSTVESVVNGVPMVAWPLYAEQNFNAAMVVEHVGVAVRPQVLPTKRVVRREEIEKMVREVMEGESACACARRTKTKQLKQSADEALEMGGSSYESMCQLVKTLSIN